MFRRLWCVLPFFLIACNDSPPGPPPPTTKSPRAYTWTADTLYYPVSLQTTMRSIWASAPNNVYVVGHNDLNRGLMYHYDGTIWQSVRLTTSEGGPIQGSIDLEAVFGFGANDIYAVGKFLYSNPNPPPNFLDSSLIIHFNGSQWQQVPIAKHRSLVSIWGSSSTDIWAGGRFGTMYHYNGVGFEQDPLPISEPYDSTLAFPTAFGITGTTASDMHVMMLAPNAIFSQRYFLFARGTGGWVLVDSLLGQGHFADLWMSGSGVLHALGDNVRRRVGPAWQQMIGSPSGIAIRGMSDDDLFVVGYGGSLEPQGRAYHYDGSDWFRFTDLEFQGVIFSDVWVDAENAFIVGATIDFPQKTIVLHGR